MLARLRRASRALQVICLLLFFRATPLALEVLHGEHGGRCACPAVHEDPTCPCPTCQTRLKPATPVANPSTAARPDCHSPRRGASTAGAAPAPLAAPASGDADDDGPPPGPRLAKGCSLADTGHAAAHGSLADPYVLAVTALLPPPSAAGVLEYTSPALPASFAAPPGQHPS
jgi:hypothetical protein